MSSSCAMLMRILAIFAWLVCAHAVTWTVSEITSASRKPATSIVAGFQYAGITHYSSCSGNNGFFLVEWNGIHYFTSTSYVFYAHVNDAHMFNGFCATVGNVLYVWAGANGWIEKLDLTAGSPAFVLIDIGSGVGIGTFHDGNSMVAIGTRLFLFNYDNPIVLYVIETTGLGSSLETSHWTQYTFTTPYIGRLDGMRLTSIGTTIFPMYATGAQHFDVSVLPTTSQGSEVTLSSGAGWAPTAAPSFTYASQAYHLQYVSGGKIYLLGGTGQADMIVEYDPVQNTWQQVASASDLGPIATHVSMAAGGVIGNTLYVYTTDNRLFQITSSLIVASGSVSGDPHFSAFSGGIFDITGQPGAVYNIIATPDFQVNARFVGQQKATFLGDVAIITTGSHVIYKPKTGELYVDQHVIPPKHRVSLCNSTEYFVAVRQNLISAKLPGLALSISRKWQPKIVGFGTTINAKLLPGGAGPMHGLLGQTASWLHPVVDGVDGASVIAGTVDDYKEETLLSRGSVFALHH